MDSLMFQSCVSPKLAIKILYAVVAGIQMRFSRWDHCGSGLRPWYHAEGAKMFPGAMSPLESLVKLPLPAPPLPVC